VGCPYRLKGEQQPADRHGLARLDMNADDLAAGGAGHLERGLAGLDFEDALILLDDIAFSDKQLQDITRVDAIAQVGHFDFDRHG
jgi:hypothetical protein